MINKSTYLIAALVVLLGLGATSWAHEPIADDGSHINAAAAITVQDPFLSQVVYHEVTADSIRLWLSFTANKDQVLHLQLGVPFLERLQNYRPTVALLGPGLPAVQLPFDVPAGLGGLVISTGQSAPTEFDEHFTGTKDWMLFEQDVTLPASGQYYIVAYPPDGAPGKLFVVMGTREEFTLNDFLAYPDTVQQVRQFHEVADQPLPFLPSVLTAIAWILRVLRVFLGF